MFYDTDDTFITINNRNKEKEKKLDKLNTVEEILDYSRKIITNKYFFELLDEYKEISKISVYSFRTLVLFVESIKKLPKWSSLIGTYEGLFVMNWRVADIVTVTLRFNEDYMVSYVIAKQKAPNYYDDADYFRGTCYCLDLMEVLEDIVGVVK